jgi:hypothetical protein
LGRHPRPTCLRILVGTITHEDLYSRSALSLVQPDAEALMSVLRGAATLLLAVCSSIPQSACAQERGFAGTLCFALLRNSPLPTPDSDFHDKLSATIAGFWAASPNLSIGPEVGYHGVETVSGIHCGPEWGVDCPAPDHLRVGAWEAAALARWQTSWSGARPYVIAGGGAYLPGNYVIESREAKIERRVEPGVTAGVGVRFGFIGVEGRWHYIADGNAEGRYDYLEGGYTYSYSPLRIYSASLSIHVP